MEKIIYYIEIILNIMIKKDPTFPPMSNHKKPNIREESLSFKVRPNLATKGKENTTQITMQKARAKNIIKKAKLFNSPEIIFALNQSIRLDVSQFQNTQQNKYAKNSTQKSLLNHTCINMRSNKSFLESKHSKPKYYALKQQRVKAINLAKWMNDKLQQIKHKRILSLEDILDYNQTVLNYGLGQIIQTSRKRCKQQGQILKMIWDNTITLFENLLNILTEQIRNKDKQMVQNQKQCQKIYIESLNQMKIKNQQNQKHMQLLYEKMKKIILWNRRLRRDRHKQQLKLKLNNYRIETYELVLQEAAQMLLNESKEPDCLKLAKKIISKLCKIKKMNKKNHKNLQRLAQEDVHKKAKQYVLQWLKKYSLQDNQKIYNSVFLTQDQKLQLIKISDQSQIYCIDINEFFQTKQAKTQTQTITQQKQVQYEYQQEKKRVKTKNVGIQTVRVLKTSLGVQCNHNQFLSQLKTKGVINYKQIRQKNLSKKSLKLIDQQKQNSVQALNECSSKKVKIKNIHQRNYNLHKNKNRNTQNQEWSSNKNFEDKQQQQIAQNNLIQDQQSLLQEILDISQRKILHKQKIVYLVGQKTQDQLSKNQNWKKSSNKNVQYFKTEGMIGDQNDIKQGLSNKFLPRIYDKNKYQRLTTESNEIQQSYKVKQLKKKKFMQIYETQMKNQYQQNKDQIIKEVVKRRSFYRQNKNRKLEAQKQLINLWYKPSRNHFKKQRKQFNQIDQNIYQNFMGLNKTYNFALNFSKMKSYQNTCNLFSNISNNLNNLTRTVPKNKQFINLSVTTIIKFFSKLLFDYLRKIKGDLEGYFIDTQRVCYPLRVILVDCMMHKYGLKQIAEKKLKDFMEKINNFVGVSEKINFFYRLLGIGEQLICSDQLLIYLKCLVYFDVKRVIPIVNVSKDFTIERILTDKQTVLGQVDLIIAQFFHQKEWQQVKWKVQKYFITYLLPSQFDIERIAILLIQQFLLIKKEQYINYLPLYKNCLGNFFPNLFKLVELINDGKNGLLKNNQKAILQIYKNADLLDQIYGKSISQQKFVGLCIRLGFPVHDQIQKRLKRLKDLFISKCPGIEERCENNQLVVEQLKKKYNIKICFEKKAPNYWLYTFAQLGHEISLINALNLLGNLKVINNSFNKLCKNDKYV